jgi:hypothetical protein
LQVLHFSVHAGSADPPRAVLLSSFFRRLAAQMKLIDVSLLLSPGLPLHPGQTPFPIEDFRRLDVARRM